MSSELARRVANAPVSRERSRDLAVVRKNADVALAKVNAVAEVGQAALLGTLGLAMMKREAAMVVPEDAPKFDYVVMTGGRGNGTANQLAGAMTAAGGVDALVIALSIMLAVVLCWLGSRSSGWASRWWVEKQRVRELARVTTEARAATEAVQQITQAAQRQILDILADGLSRRRDHW